MTINFQYLKEDKVYRINLLDEVGADEVRDVLNELRAHEMYEASSKLFWDFTRARFNRSTTKTQWELALITRNANQNVPTRSAYLVPSAEVQAGIEDLLDLASADNVEVEFFTDEAAALTWIRQI